MKNIKLLMGLTLHAFFVNAQPAISNKNYDKNINPSILRITITEPLAKDYETNSIVSFNYEQQIITAFTVVSKIGVGFSVKNFSNGNQNGQYSLHGFGSAELRYYFSLHRRIKKEKYVKNFTAPYVSIEKNIFSNGFSLINQNKKDAVQGSINTFLNIGYQGQSKKIYFGGYFGVYLGGQSLSKYGDESISSIHAGITIGYVF